MINLDGAMLAADRTEFADVVELDIGQLGIATDGCDLIVEGHVLADQVVAPGQNEQIGQGLLLLAGRADGGDAPRPLADALALSLIHI